jgi:C4-type Zn-finger protein
MTPNVVYRDRLREGVVECPLCERQWAAPREHLIVHGPETPTIETADAIECPVCDGVLFLREE